MIFHTMAIRCSGASEALAFDTRSATDMAQYVVARIDIAQITIRRVKLALVMPRFLLIPSARLNSAGKKLTYARIIVDTRMQATNTPMI